MTHFLAFHEPPNTRTMQKKYYMSTLFTANWMGAFNFCRTNGMDLVNFGSKAQLDHFLKLFMKVTLPLNARVYIDGVGNLADRPNSWYWYGTGAEILFSLPWFPGEPNNAGGVEFCISMNFEQDGQSIGFNDVQCQGNSARFVCQDIIEI